MIDDFLINLNVKIEKENTEITIEKEVKYFLECAYDDLYARPNKIVSKSEKSKWRFKVKTFYKQFEKCLNDLFGIRIICSQKLNYDEIVNFMKEKHKKLKCIDSSKKYYKATHINMDQ